MKIIKIVKNKIKYNKNKNDKIRFLSFELYSLPFMHL